MKSPILDAWYAKCAGEMCIDLRRGKVSFEDEKNGISYTVDLEPQETLPQRLKDALAEAKASRNDRGGETV